MFVRYIQSIDSYKLICWYMPFFFRNMIQRNNIGLKGHSPNVIKNFLGNRNFNIQLDNFR